MKKLMAYVASVVCILTAAATMSASAAGLDANKQKIMDALNATITVNGKTVGLTADQKTQAENYLKQDGVAISDQQATDIVAQIKKAEDVVKESGVDSISKLSGDKKTEVLGIIEDTAEIADLKVSVDSAKNTITILDKSNKVVATMEAAIKVTGPDMSVLLITASVALVLLAGSVLVAYKLRLASK